MKPSAPDTKKRGGTERRANGSESAEPAKVHKSPKVIVSVTRKASGQTAAGVEGTIDAAANEAPNYARELTDIFLGSRRSLHARVPLGSTFHELMPQTKLNYQRPFMLMAASGQPWAKTLYADFLLNTRTRRKHAPKAVEILTDAAEQGYAPAQLRLAACFANGTGVEEDFIAAAH